MFIFDYFILKINLCESINLNHFMKHENGKRLEFEKNNSL